MGESEMRRLEGRVALITAAGSGMGRASAERFAAEGAHVVVADLDEQAADDARDAIAADGGSAEAVACDVGDLDALRAVIDDVGRKHDVLHVLFNHAGIPGASGLDVDLDGWDKVVDVNMRSAFYATQFALPLL